MFLVLIVIALAGLSRLKAGNTLGAQFFERNAPVHGFRMADARLAGTRVIQVLVEGNAPDTIKNPDVLRRMDELGTFISHQPLPVGKVVSIVDLLKQMSLVMDQARRRQAARHDPGGRAVPAALRDGRRGGRPRALRRPRLPARRDHRLPEDRRLPSR